MANCADQPDHQVELLKNVNKQNSFYFNQINVTNFNYFAIFKSGSSTTLREMSTDISMFNSLSPMSDVVFVVEDTASCGSVIHVRYETFLAL